MERATMLAPYWGVVRGRRSHSRFSYVILPTVGGGETSGFRIPKYGNAEQAAALHDQPLGEGYICEHWVWEWLE